MEFSISLEFTFSSQLLEIFKGSDWDHVIEMTENCYTIFAYKKFLRRFSIEEIYASFKIEHIKYWSLLEKISRKINESEYIQTAIISNSNKLKEITKPESLNNNIVESIEKYIQEKDLMDENLEKVKEERYELERIKIKVLTQLEIINRILENPVSVNRIEEYENVFSKGNYINLKRIAEILKDSI